MTEWRIILASALLAHVVLVMSMCRFSAWADRAARARRREFRQSLLNRRGQS
jgi:hypothetical protein